MGFMKNKFDLSSPWFYAGVFILIIVMLVFAVKTLNPEQSSEELDAFAQCLGDSELTMYGTSWCSHCKSQKAAFGDSFQYVNYVDCDKDRDICTAEGIRGYPTWKINGQSYSGEQSLSKLGELAGCSLS